MTEQPAPPPAGWYPHPSMADTKRYWDGSKWTDHIAPASTAPPTGMFTVPAQPEVGTGILLAGWLMSVFFPIGGFIVGCIVIAKGKPGAGAAMMVISVVAFFFWFDAFSTPAPPTYNF